MENKKSMRQLAQEIGVSVSYLSQIKSGTRPASQKILSKLEGHLKESVKQSVKQSYEQEYSFFQLDFESGGSAWESNPPKTSEMPPNGFEVREAHRDSCAPLKLAL
jgi:transcriptional regulator with XRE-family HTH domain